jgi:CRISPR type III-B/RAMP module RAMP protein Cmr1
MSSLIISHSFRLLTPAFAHGAYQALTDNIPELRAPSIRGQLRWWWRNLGYQSGDKLFGSASGSHGSASRVQIRLILPEQVHLCKSEILPHKDNPRHRGTKQAIQENKDLYTVQLRPVRGALSMDEKEQLENTMRAWLLMGAVGQRANRSAGSVWPENNAPSSASDYLKTCRSLLQQSRIKIALLDTPPMIATEARDLSGRFLGGFNVDVPGNIFGSASPRKSSSLKLRAVSLEDGLQVAALWCPKDIGDSPENLHCALEKMTTIPAKKELASLIINTLPDLCP